MGGLATHRSSHTVISMAGFLAVAGIFLLSRSVAAQGPDLEASLRCLEDVYRDGTKLMSAPYRCPSGAVPMERIVQSPQLYGEAVVQSALDGLVDLALSTENDHVQRAVCVALTLAGLQRNEDRQPGVTGVVERIERLFFSGRPGLRHWCGARRARVLVDRPRAIEFLKRIASEPNPPDAGLLWPMSALAVSQLRYMGSEGRAAIADLMARDAISTHHARFVAERFLQRRPDGGGA